MIFFLLITFDYYVLLQLSENIYTLKFPGVLLFYS